MPDHLHAIVAFRNTGQTINSMTGNGKRFLAFDLVTVLEQKQEFDILKQLSI
ncbi:MAG: hypothetical protein ABJA79_02340 [Parafilimonas sp.]